MKALWLLVAALSIPLALEAGGVRQCIHPDGTVEWRDRPCPAGSELRSDKSRPPGGAGTFNTIPADEPPAKLLERAKRIRRQSGPEASPARPAERARNDTDLRCAEYEERIDAIDRRLRRGYTASEGNDLRAERRRIRRLLGRACR